jgi:hypothetical protein
LKTPVFVLFGLLAAAGCSLRTGVEPVESVTRSCRPPAGGYALADAPDQAFDAALDEDDRQVLMPGIFDAPAVGDGPLSTRIQGPGDLVRANRRIFVARQGFEGAYDCIRLGDASEVTAGRDLPNVLRVPFTYHNRSYEALAYTTTPLECRRQGTGALVIPGSGVNQATGVLLDASNYQRGLIDGLAGLASTFVLLKPDEDATAWHNGDGKKVSGALIWNWHLNRGGSYSVSYLLHGMAFMKYLKQCFSQTVVAGLSQGGAASLLVALQARPTAAIVASGHSVLFDQMEWSGHNQLIGVPGYARLFQAAVLRASVAQVPTRWLFTWGRADTDIYKIESTRRFTAESLRGLGNVDVVIHEGGHDVPPGPIRTFLAGLKRP